MPTENNIKLTAVVATMELTCSKSPYFQEIISKHSPPGSIFVINNVAEITSRHVN